MAGAAGQASWLVEGLEEGQHVVADVAGLNRGSKVVVVEDQG